MIAKISAYINIIISLFVMGLGLYTFIDSKSITSNKDVTMFLVIEIVYGICLSTAILCLVILKSNSLFKIHSLPFFKRGNFLFAFAIIASVLSSFIFLSLLYSFYETRSRVSNLELVLRIIAAFMLLTHSISSIINVIQYIKLKRKNKKLQTVIVEGIGLN